MRRDGPGLGVTRRARLVAILAVLAMVAAACGGAAGDETTTTTQANATTQPSEDPGTTAPADDEEIELTVWFSRERSIPADEFETFHAENPNITVNWEVIAGEEVLETLIRFADAGEPMPDVFGAGNEWARALHERELITPLDDLVARWQEEDPELYDTLFDNVWSSGTFDGQILSFPLTGDVDWLYYRKDWFEELGLSYPPTSHEEIITAGRAIMEAYPDTIGYAMRAQRGDGASYFIGHALEFGVPFGENDDGFGPPQLDTEQGRALIDWYKELTTIVDPGTIAWSFGEQRGSFIAGRAAMMPDDAGTAADLYASGDLEYGVQFDLGAAPVQGGGSSGVGLGGYYISSGTEHPYESSLILRYLADPEIAMHTSTTYTPVRSNAIWTSDEFYEAVPWFSGPGLAEGYEAAQPFPTPPNQNEIEETLVLVWQYILENPDAPTQEIIDMWQPQLDEWVEE